MKRLLAAALLLLVACGPSSPPPVEKPPVVVDDRVPVEFGPGKIDPAEELFVSTTYLDPTDSDIDKGTRDPSTPAGSPSKTLTASAGNDATVDETFGAAPSLTAVTSVTLHIYGNVTSLDSGVGAVNIELQTGAGTQLGLQQLTSTGAGWQTITVSAATLTTALGHAPTQSDITALKLHMQADAFDSGGPASTYVYTEAYLVLDYTAAGGAAVTGFSAFPH
jgi:hypothetical protein